MELDVRTQAHKHVDVFDVASYFLRQDALQGEPDVTPMKLQKLLYLAQAHYLAGAGQRLFDETIEAYEHGPVVSSVWARYAGRRTPIVDRAIDIREHGELPVEVEDFLDRVWAAYKDLSASALRKLTHEQAPWRDAFVEGRLHTPIPDAAMRRFFGSDVPLDRRIFPIVLGAHGSVGQELRSFRRRRGEVLSAPEDLTGHSHYTSSVVLRLE